MFAKRIPFYFLPIVFFSAILISWVCFFQYKKNTEAQSSVSDYECGYSMKRLKGYNYVRPLMFIETACESPRMNAIKSYIENIIATEKLNGNIASASVYLRELNSGNWININENQQFSPGSLLKVPELIAIMKMNEKQPGFLNRVIPYNKLLTSDKHANFLSKSIVLGNSYTVKELCRYMISYSDNNATLLLNQIVDVPTFNKVFTDLGLPAPDSKANQYPISAHDYSLFMRVLYNATYLTIDDSEFCTDLLSTCSFPEGMEKGLPANIKMAHKFGEGGFDNSPQYSESAIVYLNNNAYILTVMTNGSDMKKLPKVVSTIARTVYENMLGFTTTSS